MKYLKTFESLTEEEKQKIGIDRRKTAQEIFKDLKDICIDLEHDYDFKVYCYPFERMSLEDEEIVTNTSGSSIRKCLKEGHPYVGFDLTYNGVSTDFTDPKRLEILSQIKLVLNRMEEYMKTQDIRCSIVGCTYTDVPNGKYQHQQGHWKQISYSPFGDKRMKTLEKIRFRFKLN